MVEVAVLAIDDAVPFDVAVPCQIFSPEAGTMLPRYNLAVCGPKRGQVTTSNGFSLAVEHGVEIMEHASTIVVAGVEHLDFKLSEDVALALQAADARGARLVSICTGAFILAAAGILDGRRATTHWRHVAELQERYPDIEVIPDVLFVQDGSVFTSAGLAAGIDLCLHIVRLDFGAEAANDVAQQTVVAPYRPGGQSQHLQRPVPVSKSEGLAETRAWMLEHLESELSVDEMASHAAMSRRSFTRAFRDETGMSPLQWVLQQRILVARRLLEATDEPIERIPDLCGFATPAAFRSQFRRITGMSPSRYREEHRSA